MDDAAPGFDQHIYITYSPPRWLLPVVLTAHAGALICLLASALPWYIQCLLFLAVTGSLLFYLGRQILVSLDRPVSLVLDAHDKWLLVMPEPVPAILLSASIFMPGLVVLCLVTVDGRRHAFILTEENTDADALRRLRVRLYYKKNRE